uniref:Uncharacterized protein n=1 Tax=Arundo donax TaxID=35708 RepID=A0A0A9CUY7_ARUDO
MAFDLVPLASIIMTFESPLTNFKFRMTTASKASSTSLPPLSIFFIGPLISGEATLPYLDLAPRRRSGIPSFSVKSSGRTSISTALPSFFNSSNVSSGDKSPEYPP